MNEELTNQECRDLKGSLSNRGCFFDKEDKPLGSTNGATSCTCLDCGKERRIEEAFYIKEEVKGKMVLRPLCFSCNILRESKDA